MPVPLVPGNPGRRCVPVRRSSDGSVQFRTWISPTLRYVVDVRVAVNAPVCPPPVQVICHVVVAVTVYRPAGCVADDRSYTCPHVGDVTAPNASRYGVPGPAHVTECPSPMSHTIRAARAVAVTVIPGTAAVAVVGPHVAADTWVHIHTGACTTPIAPGGGANPIAAPLNVNCRTACCANCAVATWGPPTAAPAGGVARHTQPPPVPGTAGQVD
jgi:hypothetical protein